jgi:alkylhydroperoxidase/carboxymuconolactone decarboxylase family protein YurZ
MENQIKLNEERLELLEKLKKICPKVMTPEWDVQDLAYTDGALSNKVKRLMGLAIAIRAGCTNCILGQVGHAINAGATKEEFLETIEVGVAMSGTTAVAESLRVVKLLTEHGIL